MGGWGMLLVFLTGLTIGTVAIVPLLAWVAWTWGTRSAGGSRLGERAQGDDEFAVSEKGEDGDAAAWRAGLGEDLLKELKASQHVPDVASGYFAVCREYVPGGINGKPPERTTPAGAVTAMESPSVYQSMYRSIFDRNKTTTPSMSTGAQGKSKKARNVFYVVLRLGHLMLYDSSEQLEVRHVISLAHYSIDVYAGGDLVPEGELWIKRNCIRLAHQDDTDHFGDSKPFYIFSDNCSDKEDFYHAMLRSQEAHVELSPSPPQPLKFNATDLIKLVQQLHASEENLHTRWINAIVGRVFLAMYKTKQVEQFIWNKITKKIARVPKPGLISSVSVQRIDMGHLPPFLTNPKLKELTVDGDLTVEADVSYKGDFRLDISAVARIDLGSRFKAREVTLVLATMLKKLEGHILIRIKPPPSNRLWITFETPPTMEFSLEPIVSSRQITYGVILRAIESRIREVVAETLVYPNWDDMPFSNTVEQRCRGGLWTDDKSEEGTLNYETAFSDVQVPLDATEMEETLQTSEPITVGSGDSAKSMPVLSRSPTLTNRKFTQSEVDLENENVGISSGISSPSHVKPRAMRSSSYASAASPIVNADSAVSRSEGRKSQDDAVVTMRTTVARSPPSSPAAVAAVIASQHAMSDRREDLPLPSHSKGMPSPTKSSDNLSTAYTGSETTNSGSGSGSSTPSRPRSLTAHTTTARNHHHKSSSSSFSFPTYTPPPAPPHQPSTPSASTSDKFSLLNQSLSSATAASKKWLANRQSSISNTIPIPPPSTSSSINANTPTPSSADYPSPHHNHHHNPHQRSVMEDRPLGPIGRGQPLPPPGTPLPRPPKTEKKSAWSMPAATNALVNLARRKPVAGRGGSGVGGSSAPNGTMPSPLMSGPASVATVGTADNGNDREKENHDDAQVPPPLPRRRQRVSSSGLGLGRESETVAGGRTGEAELLVVEAPVGDGEGEGEVGEVESGSASDGDGEEDRWNRDRNRIEQHSGLGLGLGLQIQDDKGVGEMRDG